LEEGLERIKGATKKDTRAAIEEGAMLDVS